MKPPSRRKPRPAEARDICKPCWELNYCPYGYLVEFFPLVHPPDKARKESHEKKFDRLLKVVQNDPPIENAVDAWESARLLLPADPEMNKYAEKFDYFDIRCKVWGHACPVFFFASGATETQQGRNWGRHIPHAIMFKVVRRDDYICQLCRQRVDERDLQFDHVIPHSKGGPMTVANIRLLCGKCNRKRSNKMDDLLTT